jgi:hypothetical protein
MKLLVTLVFCLIGFGAILSGSVIEVVTGYGQCYFFANRDIAGYAFEATVVRVMRGHRGVDTASHTEHNASTRCDMKVSSLRIMILGGLGIRTRSTHTGWLV